MIAQFLVVAYTFRIEVWDMAAYTDDEIVTVDAEYLIDGRLHQYEYRKGVGAELQQNWRERCAIQAHYHATNQGSHVVAIEVPHAQNRKRRKKVSHGQLPLPFDGEGTS